MAVPLWLLYELGIVLASVIVRPVPVPVPAEAGQSDYQPPSDEEMSRELDRAEQQSSEQKT
jgi:sec-independent protein translocase protein TatC